MQTALLPNSYLRLLDKNLLSKKLAEYFTVIENVDFVCYFDPPVSFDI